MVVALRSVPSCSVRGLEFCSRAISVCPVFSGVCRCLRREVMALASAGCGTQIGMELGYGSSSRSGKSSNRLAG